MLSAIVSAENNVQEQMRRQNESSLEAFIFYDKLFASLTLSR